MNVSGLRVAAGERTLLEGVAFTVLPGELIAVVGPNGAGKTTLLRALAGFLAPQAGEVRLDGVPVRTLSAGGRARAVTLIGSDAEAPAGMSARDVVATGRYAHQPWWDWSQDAGSARATDDALARVGLTEYASRPFETLSSGERQRAWLALALAQDARLLLLDEPTSHLDPRYALDMLRLMRDVASDARTVIVVLHDLNEAAAIADRIAVLANGRLLTYARPPEALAPEVLERAFGIAFERFGAGAAIRVLPRVSADTPPARDR